MKTLDINNKFPILITKVVLQLFDFPSYKILKDYYDRKKTIMTGRAMVFPLCFFLLFLVLDDTPTRFDLQSTRLEKGPIVTSLTTSR